MIIFTLKGFEGTYGDFDAVIEFLTDRMKTLSLEDPDLEQHISTLEKDKNFAFVLINRDGTVANFKETSLMEYQDFDWLIDELSKAPNILWLLGDSNLSEDDLLRPRNYKLHYYIDGDRVVGRSPQTSVLNTMVH